MSFKTVCSRNTRLKNGPMVRSTEMLRVKGARKRGRPIKSYGEVMWKDMIDGRATVNMPSNKVATTRL